MSFFPFPVRPVPLQRRLRPREVGQSVLRLLRDMGILRLLERRELLDGGLDHSLQHGLLLGPDGPQVPDSPGKADQVGLLLDVSEVLGVPVERLMEIRK